MKLFCCILLLFLAGSVCPVFSAGRAADPGSIVLSRFPEADQAVALPADSGVMVFAVLKNGQTAGYAVLSEPRAKSGPFPVLTSFSVRAEVLNAEVLRYPYAHGRGIVRESFLRQFKGWRPGSDVDAVTGATSSSEAVADAVERSVRILKKVLRQGQAGS